VPVIVYPHVVSRLRFATVGEDRRAAGLLALPCPRVALDRYLLRADVALAVKDVCAILFVRRVIADDRGTTHTHVTDAAIGAVEHENLARHPFSPTSLVSTVTEGTSALARVCPSFIRSAWVLVVLVLVMLSAWTPPYG
jgi:hypothetical protein